MLKLESLDTVVDLAATFLPTCRFSHDAIRIGDTVFVCNTGKGSILQLAYPSMTVVRELSLFTAREHINTLGAYDTSSVWAVLHNLGKVLELDSCAVSPSPCKASCAVVQTPCGGLQSQVVQVDLSTGKEVRRFRDIGSNSHGLVSWQNMFVMLSSKETTLILMNPADGNVEHIWSVCVLRL